MNPTGCPVCGCTAASDAHAVAARLAADDLDAAIDAGLLDVPACSRCAPECNKGLTAARQQRLDALAARERFRARGARLARRAAARDAARAARADTAEPSASPALPSGAAAVLQRALARAKGRP